MKFTKIHSLGNDFLIVEEGKIREIEDKPTLARQICERHTCSHRDSELEYDDVAGRGSETTERRQVNLKPIQIAILPEGQQQSYEYKE